jgi:hypothetical protein
MPASAETPINPPEANLSIQCINIKNEMPEKGVYTGTIVLAGYLGTPSQLLNMSTGIMSPLVTGEEGNASLLESVSPDRIWLAYMKFKEDGLVVRNVDSSEITVIAWGREWWLMGWLDNQHLLISSDKGGYLIFNPFTGERKELSHDFPDLGEPIGIAADWWGYAVYNSSLTRAVYPINRGDTDGRIVLWDLHNNQVVTYLKSENNPYGGEPVWSPNGNEFIMTLHEYDPEDMSLATELHRVSQDGQQTKITNLSAYYTKFFLIKNYRWSSDASQIAFWLSYKLEEGLSGEYLAVLDLETLEVTSYCISGYFTSHAPVWSPDGKYLIVESFDKDMNRVVLLVDIENLIAYQLVEGDLWPAGWMITEAKHGDAEN